MKKVIIAIFALFYLTVSSGFTIYKHYCMGQLADWGLGHDNSKTCSKCGMEKSDEKDNGCCKDEHKFVKDDTDQKTAEAGIQLLQLFNVSIPAGFIEIPLNYFLTITEKNPVSHAPPRSCGVAVYIRNSVFLI